jgi:hypothetical protein
MTLVLCYYVHVLFYLFASEMKHCVFILPIGFPNRESAFPADMSVRLYLLCINDGAVLYPVETRWWAQ